MPDRLQKVMARAGMGSRRRCEELIRQGRVVVNGRTAELGVKVDPESDRIAVDGRTLGPPEAYVYYVLNKPRGYLSSTRSQGGKPTIMELVDIEERVYPVGRLDLDSEGLVLLTNDGEVTDHLTHPRYEHEKEYRVRLDRPPSESDLAAWRTGLTLPDGFKTAPAGVTAATGEGPGWLRIILTEGHKRQIRESAALLGFQVRRLIRVRMANLILGDMSPGSWRPLGDDETTALREELRPAGARVGRVS